MSNDKASKIIAVIVLVVLFFFENMGVFDFFKGDNDISDIRDTVDKIYLLQVSSCMKNSTVVSKLASSYKP